jgi:hypothetical protein
MSALFLFLIEETDIKLISNFHIKLTLKFFEFSHQNKQKYQQQKKFDQSLICWNMVGEYGGFWSEFDPYTDRNAYQIPNKFSYQIHIKLRSVCLVGHPPRTMPPTPFHAQRARPVKLSNHTNLNGVKCTLIKIIEQHNIPFCCLKNN